MTKKCRGCGRNKNKSEYGRNSSTHDKLHKMCKQCVHDNSQRPEIKVHKTWTHITERAENATGKFPSYANVKLLITKEEFIDWYVPALKLWRKNNYWPIKRDSVDRIDNRGHYELENLQILEWGENSRKSGHNVNVHAPAGTAWCYMCKDYLPVAEFTKDKNKYNGLESSCNACKKSYNTKYYNVYNARRRFNRRLKQYGINPPVYKGVQLQ